MTGIYDSTAANAVDDKADILKTGSANMSDTEPKDVGVENQQMLLGGEAERKLVRKLDIHIIPVVMALYLLSFLDRYVFSHCSKLRQALNGVTESTSVMRDCIIWSEILACTETCIRPRSHFSL